MLEIACPHCGFRGTTDLILEVRSGGPDQGGPQGRIKNVQLTEWPCPACGKDATVLKYDWQDFYGPYYDLLEMEISKRRAKRIIKKLINAKNIEALPVTIGGIEPELRVHVEHAIKQKEPKRWLEKLALIVGIAAGLATFVASSLGAAYTYELLKEMHLDNPVQTSPSSTEEWNYGPKNERNNSGGTTADSEAKSKPRDYDI